MTRLAIYDMDKTITRQPTYTAFVLMAAMRLAPWRLALLPLMLLTILAYLVRIVDRSGLKTLNQRLLLGAPRIERITALAEAFADRVVARNIRPGALAQIDADRRAGYRIILATASYRLYVTPIAARLGIADVIATDLAETRGRVASRIVGGNCYGVVKLDKILSWLAGQRIDRAACHVRAYSDHVSDAPMLDFADLPFAVNAHLPLRTLAATHGWETLDW